MARPFDPFDTADYTPGYRTQIRQLEWENKRLLAAIGTAHDLLAANDNHEGTALLVLKTALDDAA